MKHIKKRFRQKKDAEFRTEAGIPRAWGRDRRRLVFAHVLLDVVVVFAETLEGGPVEFLLRRGVRHRDNQPGALLQRLAVEIDGSVLRDEPVDVVARVTTPAPAVSTGAIFETPLFVIEGMAMIALPPFDSDAP